MSLMIALALAAAPSSEALALAREIADSGTLATILPLVQAKESEELVAAHPELGESEKTLLKATAKRTFEAGRERLLQSEATAIAQRLTEEDLRSIAAFQRSRASQNYRGAMPQIIGATMQTLGAMDYKKDVQAAFCKETGKLCDAAK